MSALTFTSVFFSSAHSKIDVQLSLHAFNVAAHAEQRQLQQASLKFAQRAVVQSPLKGSRPPPLSVEASEVEPVEPGAFSSSLQPLAKKTSRRARKAGQGFNTSSRLVTIELNLLNTFARVTILPIGTG